MSAPSAPWPDGRALPHDLVVPVVLTVSVEGTVLSSELEAGVGEPFDSIALETSRAFRFTPARDASGPRVAKVRALVRFVGVTPVNDPTLDSAAHDAARSPPVAAAPPPPAVTEKSAPASAPASPTPAPPHPTTSRAPSSPSAEATPKEITVRGEAPPRSASETLLGPRVLRAAPHENTGELLLSVPGVFVSQHGGEGKAQQIFFRGFDAVHGQDVEIWAAGAPVNDVSNIHGQGYADLHFLIPEVVRELRSTPGTYDPAQGDFAVAGTLRLALGYDEPGVTARAGFGSFGTKRYFLAYHPSDAPPETFGAFELESTDGFGPSRAARHASAIGQTTHDFGGGVTARLMAATHAGSFDSAGVVRLEDVESGEIARFGTYDAKQGGTSSRTQVVLELSGESVPKNDVEPERWSIAPYAVFRSLELRSNFTGYLRSPEGDSIQQLNDATTVGATASYRRPVRLLSDRDALEAGIALRSDTIRQSQHRLSLVNDRVTDDLSTPGVEATVHATDVAGYLDANLHPVRRVTLRGGVRADGLSYVTERENEDGARHAVSTLGAQLSKRGTVDVALWPGVNVLASYGEGFRSPQARSLSDGETTPFTRVTSYEAGLRYREGTRLQASVAAFRTLLGDDLVFDQLTARNERVSATSRQGIAANLIAEPSSWFVSSTSLTYARATFEESGGQYEAGELLPYVPQLVGRAELAFSPVLGAFGDRALRSHFGSGVTYFGRRPLPYGEFGHDALLLDASGQLRWGPYETRLEVYNLLDSDWYDGEFVYASDFGGNASLVPVRHVTVGPPRTLLWSLAIYL
jgi:hypothetical protein